MRTEPDKAQSVIVWLLVDQHQVGFDVAIPMILPVAGQHVVAMTWCKRLIVRKGLHDGE